MTEKFWPGLKQPEGKTLLQCCVRCGGIKFNSWITYKDHMRYNHELTVTSEVKPVNKTGRTVRQIVGAMEAGPLAPHLIFNPEVNYNDKK